MISIYTHIHCRLKIGRVNLHEYILEYHKFNNCLSVFCNNTFLIQQVRVVKIIDSN